MFYTALSDFTLFFCNLLFITFFLIFGYYNIDRKAFLNTSVICLFASVVNLYLKSYWMVPLNTEIGAFGWAYPSGHTTFTTVLWVSLAIQLRKKWIYYIAFIGLPFEFIAMIVRRYHVVSDIIGGLSLSLIIVASFYPLIKNGESFSRRALITIFLMIVVLLFFHPPINGYRLNYVATLGFLSTLIVMKNIPNNQYTFWQSIINAIFCITLAYIFIELLSMLFYNDIPLQLSKGAGLAVILIYSPMLLNKLKMKFSKSVLAFW